MVRHDSSIRWVYEAERVRAQSENLQVRNATAGRSTRVGSNSFTR